MASAACKKLAGVPVELSVATIFCPIMALFPIPVMITRPLAFKIISTQAKKSAFTDFTNFAIAIDSSLIVLTAIAFNALRFFNAQFILKKFVYSTALYIYLSKGKRKQHIHALGQKYKN
jgi:hypothetical protein